MESSSPTDPGVETEADEGNPARANDPEETGVASDPELEELLDISLNEFGKHLPGVSGSGSAQPGTEADRSSSPRASVAGVEEFEEIFSEEFAAQAEAQLDEAMHMLASENPELWEELETLAQSVGQSRSGQAAAPPGSDGTSSLDAKLEETIRQLRQSTEQIESGGAAGAGGLSEMLGGLDLSAEGGEDSLVQVMEGVMSTLLSKEVLYPSLSELCSQYPQWLDCHKHELSPEEHTRYSRQLEVMRAICGEFDRSSEAGEKQAKFETILQLMQQLQQYGQPPDELAGQTASLPTQLQSAQNCPVM